MLQLLNINNIALIDSLRVDFETGLNLLTGETGSGKSIIVDALGILIGGRFASEVLKSGTDRAFVEGSFLVSPHPQLQLLLTSAGIDRSGSDDTDPVELIIRRELTATGRNKIFINNQLATQSVLRELRPFLVDIHGQGDQQSLFNPATHLELLDEFAETDDLREQVKQAFERWESLRLLVAWARFGRAELKLSGIYADQFPPSERPRHDLRWRRYKHSTPHGVFRVCLHALVIYSVLLLDVSNTWRPHYENESNDRSNFHSGILPKLLRAKLSYHQGRCICEIRNAEAADSRSGGSCDAQRRHHSCERLWSRQRGASGSRNP